MRAAKDHGLPLQRVLCTLREFYIAWDSPVHGVRFALQAPCSGRLALKRKCP